MKDSYFVCTMCKRRFKSPLCAKEHCRRNTGSTCTFCKENIEN
ncbi:Protein of unknown function [Gryllus bimaculatus]|nr:Protein of unknown function [Gryllus bimaculatus]